MIMQFDAYPRFLKSDLYTATLKAEQEGKPFPYTCLTAASASNSPTSGARFRSKSREKNRATSSKKVNSASFISNSSSDLNAISDDSGATSTRRSFFTYKKGKYFTFYYFCFIKLRHHCLTVSKWGK